jgi:hypothetical protein
MSPRFFLTICVSIKEAQFTINRSYEIFLRIQKQRYRQAFAPFDISVFSVFKETGVTKDTLSCRWLQYRNTGTEELGRVKNWQFQQ